MAFCDFSIDFLYIRDTWVVDFDAKLQKNMAACRGWTLKIVCFPAHFMNLIAFGRHSDMSAYMLS